MGTIFGVLASLTVSLNSIYTKRVLPAVDDNVRLLVFYNNINAMILFVPLIVVFGEIPEIYSYPDLFSISFFLLMTAGGLFGLAIGYVTGLQVQVMNIQIMKYDTFDHLIGWHCMLMLYIIIGDVTLDTQHIWYCQSCSTNSASNAMVWRD